MSSVKFIDGNQNSILIKYDFRSGSNWYANHYFDIEGDICHNTYFGLIKPNNREQAALIDFVIKNHNTKGTEYLSDFDALALNVSEAEQEKKTGMTFLSNRTSNELYEIIKIMHSFHNSGNLKFSIDNIKRVIALLQHLQDDFELPLECLYKIEENGNEFSIFNRSYLILTNDEADDKADAYYRDNAQELLDIDNQTWDRISPYFDEDKFVDECLQDGRDRALASYDGNENSELVEIDNNKEWFYIYRQN